MTRIQQLTAALLCAALFGATTAAAQTEISGRTEETAQNDQQNESALRRFEIITLTALPFTAAHSYFLMKGYRSLRAGSLAAPVEGGDWNVVIAGAAVLAAGIGFYGLLPHERRRPGTNRCFQNRRRVSSKRTSTDSPPRGFRRRSLRLRRVFKPSGRRQ